MNTGRLLCIIPLLLALGGCGGAKFLTFEPGEEAKQFHPPLPAPVIPVIQEPVIVTPDLAKKWNLEIEAGERQEYVVYGWALQDWLTMGQYDERKDYYIRQLLNILKWYGHPDLIEPEPEEPVKDP